MISDTPQFLLIWLLGAEYAGVCNVTDPFRALSTITALAFALLSSRNIQFNLFESAGEAYTHSDQ